MKARFSALEEQILSRLPSCRNDSDWNPPFTEYIKTLRSALRMTQAQLAKRAGVTQPHLAAIENGKIDPQIKTLRRIFDALFSELTIIPQPKADIKDVLRGRARKIARERLNRVVGTMAMEGRILDPEVFDRVLEKQVDKILNDSGEQLWETGDDGA